MLPDNLPSAKHLRRIPVQHLNVMPELPQPLDDILRHALLHEDLVVDRLALLGPAGGLDTDPRRVQSRLWIHTEHLHVHQHLHVALRLHEAAHDTVTRVQTTVVRVRDHRRDDGVIRSLPRRVDVRVVGRTKREIAATVLQREATALGDDGGAETRVVADDEGAGVAFWVGGGQVDGVGFAEGRGAVLDCGD